MQNIVIDIQKLKKIRLYTLLFILFIATVCIGSTSYSAAAYDATMTDCGISPSGEISSTVDFKDVANNVRSTVMNMPQATRVVPREQSPIQIHRPVSTESHNSLCAIDRHFIKLISSYYIGRQTQRYEFSVDYYIYTLKHIII
ncbi:MAG: hypothetical protein PHD11_08320 [Bacteroidales bacterium]|nr:hypothetical protein [Bacteroidales bacterium]MDD4669603.1 hypothetical protein [Bacteroidales bacterium]